MKPLKEIAAWGTKALAAGNADSVAAVGSNGTEVREQTAQ